MSSIFTKFESSVTRIYIIIYNNSQIYKFRHQHGCVLEQDITKCHIQQ